MPITAKRTCAPQVHFTGITLINSINSINKKCLYRTEKPRVGCPILTLGICKIKGLARFANPFLLWGAHKVHSSQSNKGYLGTSCDIKGTPSTSVSRIWIATYSDGLKRVKSNPSTSNDSWWSRVLYGYEIIDSSWTHLAFRILLVLNWSRCGSSKTGTILWRELLLFALRISANHKAQKASVILCL